MRNHIALIVIGCVGAGAARADFVLGGQPRVLGTLPTSSAPGAGAAAAHPPTIVSQPLPPPDPTARRFATIQGFGRRVPLAFAVRQIVPHKIHVTFGTGVDQATLVDWRGGRSWFAALRYATKPEGLHVKLRKGEVTIGK